MRDFYGENTNLVDTDYERIWGGEWAFLKYKSYCYKSLKPNSMQLPNLNPATDMFLAAPLPHADAFCASG